MLSLLKWNSERSTYSKIVNTLWKENAMEWINGVSNKKNKKFSFIPVLFTSSPFITVVQVLQVTQIIYFQGWDLKVQRRLVRNNNLGIFSVPFPYSRWVKDRNEGFYWVSYIRKGLWEKYQIMCRFGLWKSLDRYIK